MKKRLTKKENIRNWKKGINYNPKINSTMETMNLRGGVRL